ncbi:unnamed protein product [Meloidogyne enterolobii]|uniref:Uncharacterized protein n=1 Tax=Meloidogyne enterolobii TaxID=390850 RepID=A0ACB1BA30_MELEN
METKMESRQWLDLNLKCLDVISHNRSSKLVISTENMSKNLTQSQKNDLSQILKVNSSIYLQIPNFSSDNFEHFISPGIVVSVFNGGFSVYFNQPIDDSTPFLVYFLSILVIVSSPLLSLPKFFFLYLYRIVRLAFLKELVFP